MKTLLRCVALLVASLFLMPAMGQTINGATYSWSMPYFGDDTNGQTYDTVSDAVTAEWQGYVNNYAPQPGCDYVAAYYTPSSENGGVAATLTLTNPDVCDSTGPETANVYATASVTQSPDQTLGQPDDACSCAGDPVVLSVGNKLEKVSDGHWGRWLKLDRYYNSIFSSLAPATSQPNGSWSNTYTRMLGFVPASNAANHVPYFMYGREDGRVLRFYQSGTGWSAGPSVHDVLTATLNGSGTPNSVQIKRADTLNTETYQVITNANGTGALLTSITDSNGMTTSLTYGTGSGPNDANPGAGYLATVIDPNGRSLKFNWTYNDALGASVLSSVTTPDGAVAYTYTFSPYTSWPTLTKVTYPDGSAVQYTWNEAADVPANWTGFDALTGVIDETNTRYETTTYGSNGQALSTGHPNGVDAISITYAANGSASVAEATGATENYTFAVANGTAKVSTRSTYCETCGGLPASVSYDASSNPSSTVDFNGNVTSTNYDTFGLLQQRIDAKGQSTQRTTTFTWDDAIRKPTLRTVANAQGNAVAQTGWVYNTLGEVLARCDIDPTQATGYTCSNTGSVPTGVRRWTYTYCTAVSSPSCPIIGLLLTETGPRTDVAQVTSYTYYTTASSTGCGTPDSSCYRIGDLHTVTDAMGHVTTIVSYDAAGRPTRITDANGVNTDMTYTARGWLASRTVGGAVTAFTYTPYGTVHTVTDPDNIVTTFDYDTAHRLTQITDAQGNYIQYTLDAAGNKKAEKVYDSAGTLHRSVTRTFNALGQLTSVIDGLSKTIFSASYSDSYDGNGNLIHASDGLGVQRKLGYDALNRLQQTLDNYDGTDSTANTTTGYTYDSLDRLTQVTDPSNLATTYSYDGLSDATGQVSPDTGTTSRTFDAAGNVLTRTDAKGITATNTYDALDRLISTSYPDTTQNITYTYDEANSVTGCSSSYPVGRLTRIIENTVTTVFCYDALGRVIQKQQVTASNTDTTGYSYTSAERLSGIVYPSGTLVSYARDGDGRIQSVSVTPPGGTASTAVSSVTYQPFGPVSAYTLGNGQQVARTYDANYRLTDLTSPAFNLHVARDVMGDITAIGNAPGANPATETYAYDPLYRLLSVTEANGSTLESVTYNPTGDRLTKTGSGLDAGTYTYNANTHQLNAVGNNAFTVDANGNTTAMTQAGSTYGFGYNDRNRMTVAQLGGSTMATYTYNALNERIQKVTGTATERYDYNEGSQMLSEYGATNRDYIWMDDIPVANVDTSGSTSTITYVTADQLGTPRAIVNSSGTTEWSLPYQGNPWSEVAPTSNGYVYNLRSAGEYADAETGLNDNINRTRNPNLGRFGQSDPTGLSGGISTYAAVGNNPLRSTDRLGLQDEEAEDPIEEYESLMPTLGPNQVTSESPMQRDLDRGTCLAPGATDPGPVLRNEEESLPLTPAEQAAAAQNGEPYNPDPWTNTTLNQGDYVVGATPGPSPYYTDLQTYNNTDGSAPSYYSELQIQPNTNPTYPPYRDGVTVYEVTQDGVQAATGTAGANPNFGSGGGTQYYIPGYENYLTPVYSIPFK